MIRSRLLFCASAALGTICTLSAADSSCAQDSTAQNQSSPAQSVITAAERPVSIRPQSQLNVDPVKPAQPAGVRIADVVDEAATATVVPAADVRLIDPVPEETLDPEQELALHEGILKFETGQYAEALEVLKAVDPNNAIATRYRSLCLLELGQLRSAIVELQSTANTSASNQLNAGVVSFAKGKSSEAIKDISEHARSNPNDAYSQLLLGASLAEEGDIAGAQRALAVAEKDSQLAPYAQPLQFELNNLSRFDVDQTFPQGARPLSYNYQTDEEPQRYNLAIVSGIQYDSNVGQSSNFTGLGAVTDKDDVGMFVGLFGDYRVIQRPDFNVGLLTSLYSNWFFDQKQFDIQDYSGGIYVNKLLTEHIFASARYEFHAAALGNSHYSNEHRFVPSINLLEGDFGHTTWFYEYDSLDLGTPVLIAPMDPSADIHAFGVTQAIYTFDGVGRIFAGYRYENANARGADFDRQTNQANLRIEAPLTQQLFGDIGIRYFWDNYDNPNNLDFALRARKDERSELRTGLQYSLSENISTRLDYTWTNSTSNTANLFGVQFFDYSRHQVMAQWIYDF